MEVEATQALTTVLRNGDDRPAAAREISWELESQAVASLLEPPSRTFKQIAALPNPIPAQTKLVCANKPDKDVQENQFDVPGKAILAPGTSAKLRVSIATTVDEKSMNGESKDMESDTEFAAKCPTVTAKCWLPRAPSPTPTLHLTCVADSHVLASHAVDPSRPLPDPTNA